MERQDQKDSKSCKQDRLISFTRFQNGILNNYITITFVFIHCGIEVLCETLLAEDFKDTCYENVAPDETRLDEDIYNVDLIKKSVSLIFLATAICWKEKDVKADMTLFIKSFTELWWPEALSLDYVSFWPEHKPRYREINRRTIPF